MSNIILFASHVFYSLHIRDGLYDKTYQFFILKKYLPIYISTDLYKGRSDSHNIDPYVVSIKFILKILKRVIA